MKLPIILSLFLVLGGSPMVHSQDESKKPKSAKETAAPEMPEMPKAGKEHEWLKQLAGEWESESEINFPGAEAPIKGKGSESARMLGDFWLISEGKGEMMGMKMSSVLTLGYDADAKKYTGTWVDSMGGYLWKYEGSLDTTGKILTLNTEGPCPLKPGKCNFKEVIEMKDKDTRVFTSSIQGDDGKWTTMVKMTSKRKK